MKHLPVTRDPQLTPELRDRRSTTPQTRWDRLVAAFTNPELVAVVIIGITACLIVVKLVQSFPDAGLTIEQFSEFM